MDNHIAASNLFKHLPFVRNICLLGSSYSSLVILSILASNKAINCAIIYNGVFDLNYMGKNRNTIISNQLVKLTLF